MRVKFYLAKFSEKRFLVAFGVVITAVLVAFIGPESEDTIVKTVEAAITGAVLVMTALGYIQSEARVDVEKVRRFGND